MMSVGGVALILLAIGIGALALLGASLPGWPSSKNDATPNELRVMATIAAALLVVGIVLLGW